MEVSTKWADNTNPYRCEAITRNGTRCQNVQVPNDDDGGLTTMKSAQGDWIRVCDSHVRHYKRKGYKEYKTTKKSVEDLKRFEEEDQAFHEQMQRVRVPRRRPNQPMQNMLVPEALPKPAFVTAAQFQRILDLIEARHYPENKQTVIQVALDEGFVQQDNNFQSKVERYVGGFAPFGRWRWTDPLRQWKRDIQETELHAGGKKLLALRRAFNRYALQK